MLNLLERYWNYKSSIVSKVEAKQLELQEKARIKREWEEKAKEFGKYVKMAKNSKDKPLRKEDANLTKLFQKCIESGVSSVKTDTHYCNAEFKNGYEVKFWIANRMYSYASSSVFKDPQGNIRQFPENVMPEFWMCFMIEDLVENFYGDFGNEL